MPAIKKDKPKEITVSTKITEQQLIILETVAEYKKTTVSQLLRQAIHEYSIKIMTSDDYLKS